MDKVATADHCDKCDGQVTSARLDTGGSSGVFLCRDCWQKEMVWRNLRNSEVTSKFKIKAFPLRGGKHEVS